MNYAHPFLRVLGYWRVSDIMEVDIMEFRVYISGAMEGLCHVDDNFALLIS